MALMQAFHVFQAYSPEKDLWELFLQKMQKLLSI